METLRLHEDVALYYLTFSVVAWLPVFINEEPCRIVTESLNFCHREKDLRINAFVIMPTHMHLIASDVDFDTENFGRTLTAMRKYTGQRLSTYCEKYLPFAFGDVLRNAARTDRVRQFWQQSRHPEGIWTRDFWESKVRYLHDNPRRKGLVRNAVDWRFSSARFWLLEPPGDSDVMLTAVEWY